MPSAHLVEAITAIQDADSREALHERLSEGVTRFGFDRFAVAINVSEVSELFQQPLLTSLDRNVAHDYDRFRPYDFVLMRAIGMGCQYYWSSRLNPENVGEKRVFDYLRAVPLMQGVVIPLPHRPGRLSAAIIVSGKDDPLDQQSIHFASIVTRAAVMRAETLGLCSFSAEARLAEANLTSQQIEILNWAAQGKSNCDIATITGRSARSVDYHMREILRKLKVATRAQAIALTTGPIGEG